MRLYLFPNSHQKNGRFRFRRVRGRFGGVVEGSPGRDTVVANIRDLVDRAREDDIPVVWVQHRSEQLRPGSEEWRIVPELDPGESEPLVEKAYGDSFEDTNLESILADLGIGRLVVVGAQTDACIRSTLHGALVRGYDTTLVSDAHTTEDLSAWGAPPPDLVTIVAISTIPPKCADAFFRWMGVLPSLGPLCTFGLRRTHNAVGGFTQRAILLSPGNGYCRSSL